MNQWRVYCRNVKRLRWFGNSDNKARNSKAKSAYLKENKCARQGQFLYGLTGYAATMGYHKCIKTHQVI